MVSQLRRRQSGPSWWEDTPLASMRDEMDQLLSRFFGGGEGVSGTALLSPSLDLSETDNEVEVRMDLPGFQADEIEVNLNRDVLIISGEHREEKEEKEEGRRYHRIERRRGSFHRTVQLPSPVDEQQIDASFKDGVLTIVMPKAEEGKSHKIPVKH